MAARNVTSDQVITIGQEAYPVPGRTASPTTADSPVVQRLRWPPSSMLPDQLEALMRQSRARRTRTAVLGLVSIALVGATAASVAAADPPPGILVPIGSDYQADTMQLFAAAGARPETRAARS